MSQSSFFYDALLPFPLKIVLSATGPVRVYEIPDDQKQAVLEKLYPFLPVPSLDDVMEDIHAEKKFKVREFLVVREGKMNVLASPYYLENGGTVIDWVPVRRARRRRRGKPTKRA
ncbi:MAG: hypothetical protein H5U05_09380 [Candidatus Aminicenantes bacterium]|nr:hypothetical protein [Candidatus Aminicenantes bacterium]